MAGIYVHIPFCKQACHYCNFHFSTSVRYKAAMLESIAQELVNRKTYLQGQTIGSIYFGGGTPSLLSPNEVEQLLQVIQKNYTLAEDLEITLEANPDDLTTSYLQAIRQTPINRFSIGVQSFFENDLQFMNRAHNAQEAQRCIQLAQDQGFDNLTIDLIYGSPTTSHEQWSINLAIAFELNVPHLSCYALTVEPKTALDYQIKKGIAPTLSEDHAATQFEILLAQIAKNNYEQYEISNFCRGGFYAKHNTNYWTGVHYLGVGPSAHSFNGHSRQWNVANNAKYTAAITKQDSYFEIEELSPTNQHNEYIMTALRTKWGVQKSKIVHWDTQQKEAFDKKATQYQQQGYMLLQNEAYILTPKGKLIADNITADFFI